MGSTYKSPAKEITYTHKNITERKLIMKTHNLSQLLESNSFLQ